MAATTNNAKQNVNSKAIVPCAMYDYLKIKNNKQIEPSIQLAPPIPTTQKPLVTYFNKIFNSCFFFFFS